MKSFAHILILILVLVGIAVGVYLAKHPQVFKGKANSNVTGIIFSGNGVSSEGTLTTSQNINLTLHYVPPPPPSPTTRSFPGDFQDITQADGYIFGVRDESWRSMDAAKIVDNPKGGYLAVYHSNFGNNIFKTFLATSNSIVGWLDWHNPIQLDDDASMPTIFRASNGGYIVAEEKTVPEGNYLKFLYFDSIDSVLQNHPSATYSAPHSLSNCNEGTPNIYSANIDGNVNSSTIEVGFHYYENCQIDREAKGTLTNFNSWSAQPEANINSQLLNGGFGLTSNSDFGQRDNVQINGKSYNLMEVQGTFGDWTSWRLYLVDLSNGQVSPFNIHRPSGITDSANPHISLITSPSGNPALVITTFIPSEGAAANEPAGQLIYYREISHPNSTTSPFPTSFKVANSQTELATATEQNFDSNDKQIPWNLTEGNGAKTVFAQFRIRDTWSDPISANITLTLPAPTLNLTSSLSQITLGQNYTISWSTTNSSSCSASTAGPSSLFSGNQPSSGSVDLTPTQPGTYTHTLLCRGNSLTIQKSTSVLVKLPDCTSGIVCTGGCTAPDNSCGTSNGKEDSCQKTTLDNGSGNCNKVSADAQPCGLDKCASGFECVSNSCTATPISTTLTSSKTQVTLGQPYTLNYSGTNSTNCSSSTIGPDASLWAGNLASISGTSNITPVKVGQYTHTLSCSNSNNSQHSESSITVTVVLPDCNKTVDCSGSCNASTPNTCSSNNGMQSSCSFTQLDNGSLNGSDACNRASAPDQKCSISACGTGYSCSTQSSTDSSKCLLPDCTKGVICTGICTPTTANTCSANNGKEGSCKLTKLDSDSDLCNKITTSDQLCTVGSCSSGYNCTSGSCLPNISSQDSHPQELNRQSAPSNTPNPIVNIASPLNNSPSQTTNPQPVSNTPQPKPLLPASLPTPPNQTAFSILKQRSQIPVFSTLPLSSPSPTAPVTTSPVPRFSINDLPIIGPVTSFFREVNDSIQNFLNGKI